MAAMRTSFLAFGLMEKTNESLQLYMQILLRRYIISIFTGSVRKVDDKSVAIKIAKMHSTKDISNYLM
jgi:hypothetical protein